jgi:large conductance mechanosensitive channel
MGLEPRRAAVRTILMLKDFRDFAFKGNVIDMAVGIIIGAAFTTVIASLVADLLMPVLGLVTGGMDFSGRFTVIAGPEGKYATAAAAKAAGATVLGWGNFLTALISFLLVAFALFLVVKKVMGALKKEEPKPQQEEAAPAAQEVLLAEIRDLLRNRPL